MYAGAGTKCRRERQPPCGAALPAQLEETAEGTPHGHRPGILDHYNGWWGGSHWRGARLWGDRFAEATRKSKEVAPLVACKQQTGTPVIGYLCPQTPAAFVSRLAAFRQGFEEPDT